MHIRDQTGYSFLKILVFVNCFIFYGYCILVFALFCKLWIFKILVRIKKDNKLNQNLHILWIHFIRIPNQHYNKPF